MRRAHIRAVGAVTALLVYYEAYRWVPLGRWNWQFTWPVRNDQFYPDIVIGVLLVWVALSFARTRRVAMRVGTCLLALWAAVHLFDWWIPYAKSSPQNAGRYSFYSKRTQILPVIGSHYPPDAGHAVLDFLLFPALALALTATISSHRSERTPANAI